MMKETSVFKSLLVAGLILGAGFLGGCSAVAPPKEALSQADLAVREASATKASQYAPLELRRARDKLEDARRAMEEEHYLSARRLAEEALVDAQLAREKAQSEVSRQNAEALKQSIESLKAETLR